MNILIVGGGGREHALAWKVAQSSRIQNVYVAPGNAGTAREAKVTNIAITADDPPDLLKFAQGHHVDLTIIGPEVPLVLGITDLFAAAGLRCFGPSQAAAQLEGSKAFAKDFLARHHIPTARYQSFTDADVAEAYIRETGAPIVVKADGLAAGKGVILAQSADEAIAAVRGMLSGADFGAAGRQVVIEEFLHGEEASFIVMTDGAHILPFASSQDHKARDNGDQGPNTGGMGAYSPAPVVTPALHVRIMTEIIEPTVRGMAAEGCRYIGFLYAGVMITADGPKVLEYNCRLGDPETQPLIMRLRSDLVELCEAALDGRLDAVEVDWDPRPALGVVMTAAGYPGRYRQGDVIEVGSASDEVLGDEVKLFHAGTLRTKNGDVVTHGGRVMCATALGTTVAEAQSRAYNLVKRVRWEGAYYRTDIGYRAIARELRE
ncbi:phosphoribosylamine--glycine ligase [Candidatus Contendibacter odensensis]|uniref:Phosphoribosylamine--glycine ligase n=1 Tax=Candidatus Contendobacter odensis Run_B_J11 TaxID=1400861 RepID=A0A7U7J1Y6_9GAMM|nr:phosphoribosylamine--glycine ligase [Candidatus Contendobacter odensis]CDH44293.1 phosphoribosylglycinamide synthetase (GAR synthetase) [Candidatus Contendobacter odensis Run_B_J11]